MDERSVLIVNLAKGRLGADSADTPGSMIVATIAMAALSRTDQSAESRAPFASMLMSSRPSPPMLLLR
jgi:hypothetical protein